MTLVSPPTMKEDRSFKGEITCPRSQTQVGPRPRVPNSYVSPLLPLQGAHWPEATSPSPNLSGGWPTSRHNPCLPTLYNLESTLTFGVFCLEEQNVEALRALIYSMQNWDLYEDASQTIFSR